MADYIKEADACIELASGTDYKHADPAERAKVYLLQAIATLLLEIAKKMPTSGDIDDVAKSIGRVVMAIGDK